MQNSSRIINVADNPKFQLIKKLIKDCYLSNVNHSFILNDGGTYTNYDGPFCPRTFDGFACWDETPAGSIAIQPCPGFVIGFDPRRLAYKSCTDNGTWYIHPESSKPWTNYTTCVDVEDLNFRNIVNNIYVGGYSISVAALMISLIVFMYFRSLQCTRIRIHMHLFAAFVLNNVLWILWYRAVVNRPDIVQENKEWCQVLHVITHYFMVSSYFWMFCEGLHLHISLVVVFVREEVALRWFVALGWGLSLFIVMIYTIIRYRIPGATDRCWMEHSDTFWIIVVPVVISLLASFVFLVNVVRVLVTKLHRTPNQQASSLAAKKAARAALILHIGEAANLTLFATVIPKKRAGILIKVPLFGLHFVLIPLRPPTDSPFEKVYQIVSALLTSLQGLCVAVLFCFTNHDIKTALRNQLSRMFQTNDALAMTGITGGESLMNTRDNVV